MQIAIYIDTETMYLDATRGMSTQLNTIAHEAMHMSNFYRRSVLMGPEFGYDLWLEEMTAMMMEDAASNLIDTVYHPIRDGRYPDYLAFGSYNCPLLSFTFPTPCDSYSSTGSFGGYLLRQMGMPFYKNLLRQNLDDSEAALTAALKTVQPEATLGQQIRKFSVAAVAALPAFGAPAGYGFPQRVDGLFNMPVIDAQTFKLFRLLPSTAPTTLEGYASFPVVRKAVTGTFTEVVRVPAGSSLTVVVN